MKFFFVPCARPTPLFRQPHFKRDVYPHVENTQLNFQQLWNLVPYLQSGEKQASNYLMLMPLAYQPQSLRTHCNLCCLCVL